MKKLLSILALLIVSSLPLFSKGWWVPECPNGKNHEYHEYTQFQLCYNEDAEQPYFVSYHLTKADILAEDYDRISSFKQDPFISTKSASNNDYKKSGYDKGHLAPNDDMNHSEQAQRESFYLSNVSPQLPSFNRGIWKSMEDVIRKEGGKYSDTYVVTGPVLDGDYIERIGENNVAVPKYFFKVILFADGNTIKKVYAFLINQLIDEKASIKNRSLNDWNKTIAEIETFTKLKFFPTLPTAQRTSLLRNQPTKLTFD